MQILTIHQIIEGVCAKNLKTTLLFLDFPKAFDFIQRKDESNSTGIWSPAKNCHSDNDALQKHESNGLFTNEDTNLFSIVTRVLQGDILALYMFIIGQDYVNRSNKRKWFHI